jgi:hypothetical protein
VPCPRNKRERAATKRRYAFVVAIFGRNSARQRLRRAARESLKAPTFNSAVDCTPWVTGGLWPPELATITTENASLVRHLRADLESIVSFANEELVRIRHAGLAYSARRIEESRIIDRARGRALQRVESTVRHLRNTAPPSLTGYRSTYAGDGTETTSRFNIAPPRSHPQAPHGIPAATTSVQGRPPTPDAEQVRNRDLAPTEGPPPSARAIRTQEKASEELSQADSPGETDYTEVIENTAANLGEVAHLAKPTPPGLSSRSSAEPAALRAEIAADEKVAARRPGRATNDELQRQRVDRLLSFVVQQEPRLCWAVGVRADGSTLLVTDLAHGWIPPGLKLPAGIQLLEPSRRKGTASALLGQTISSAIYAPGDALSGATDDEATSTLSGPRKLPTIDDLGWFLNNATHWRDGLPKFVNTLAKASAAGTGILNAEVELLRTHLDASRNQLLTQYPEVDARVLLNCLLLASTEALAVKNIVEANYHFAWFRKLSASECDISPSELW